MISAILYGRNDPYGYNLHKRAVISLNAIAAVLKDADDEIIFVDYNTPDDNPTFIEAIADMLSPECQKMLRVIRVRPEFHQKYFAKRTHLNALEPISRNIAVRRSNPRNRWILSTNTDMVFVPLNGAKSLSAVCAKLPKKVYEIPRFEVPESMWESMDRADGPGLVRKMYEWSRDLHLHEVVRSYREIIYDGPGDFQLIPRDDLFKIDGFDEDMLLGWHVDSNLCKRFYLLYGETGTLIDKVYGYHCDHTRVASIAHRPDSTQNSWRRFTRNVLRPDIPEQAGHWGYPDIEFEEFYPGQSPTQTYTPALQKILKGIKQPAYYEQFYTSKFYDKVQRAPAHVLPYLATLLSTLPRKLSCGYCGKDPEMFALFVQVWKQFGFTGKVTLFDVAEDMAPMQKAAKRCLGYAPAVRNLSEIGESAGILVFDGGDLGDMTHYSSRIHSEVWERTVGTCLGALARAEIKDMRQGKPRMRKYIVINAICTKLELLTDKYLAATRTPFGSHVRHGYVVPPLENKVAS